MNLDTLLATLEAPIVVRPTRRMTQGELETYLDKAADILRGNADHSEFRGYVFALLFYKRINDCFEEDVRTQTVKLAASGLFREQAQKETVNVLDGAETLTNATFLKVVSTIKVKCSLLHRLLTGKLHLLADVLLPDRGTA
jgi:hypothetical protein